MLGPAKGVQAQHGPPTRKDIMPSKATCPDCRKILPVSPAGYFPAHRRPTSGTCVAGPASLKVRQRDLLHDCRRCRDLPSVPPAGERPPDQRGGNFTEYRPAVPRKIAGKVGRDPVCATHLAQHQATIEIVHPCIDCRELPLPDTLAGVTAEATYGSDAVRPPEPRPIKGKRRCASHLRDRNEVLRKRRSSARRLATHGVSDELSAQAREAQGGGCACGRPFSPKYTPRTDHSHQVARGECGHDPDHACPNCYRGDLHDQCNVIIGRMSPAQLRNLASYVEDGGTMARLRRQQAAVERLNRRGYGTG